MVTNKRLSFALLYLELNSITRVANALNVEETEVTVGLNALGLDLYAWYKDRSELHGIMALSKVVFLLKVRFNLMLKNKDDIRKLIALWLARSDPPPVPLVDPSEPTGADLKYLYIMKQSVQRTRLQSTTNLYGLAGCRLVGAHEIQESAGICYDLIFEVMYSGEVPDIQVAEL
ncbi:MAG: hypothetical protein GY938_13215 [Ketobacter sp.]|nr:hypothetical protein [Ketobacter sp.]